MNFYKTRVGFSIIELAAVMVILGILISVTATTYMWLANDARDETRLKHIEQIQEGLTLYRLHNGDYPEEYASGSFEASSDRGVQFLTTLQAGDYIPESSVYDPVNSSGYEYRYIKYSAGANGCDTDKGSYYVLIVTKGNSTDVSPESPGFNCGVGNWNSDGAGTNYWYVSGKYQFNER